MFTFLGQKYPLSTFVCDGLNLFQRFGALYIPLEHEYITIRLVFKLYC